MTLSVTSTDTSYLNWQSPSLIEGEYSGFLNALAGSIETGSAAANQALHAAFQAMVANPSDPTLLADYQSKLSQYTLLRNAESNIVKVYKDISSGIISNFR